MTAHHRYQAYRLQIISDHPLPALLPGDPNRAPDVRLHWQSEAPGDGFAWRQQSSRLLDQHQLVRLQRAATPKGEYVRLSLLMNRTCSDSTIDLLISPRADQVWIRPGSGVPLADAESAWLNVGLGCVLRLRGVVCLHGNTVVVDGRAVTIVGPKKAGKSTTAAALIRHGAKLLADDIAAITERGGTALVEPGFPSLRLWPQSLSALHGDYERLPLVFTDRTKRYLPVPVPADGASPEGGFHRHPAPLAAIYLLGCAADDTVPSIVPARSPETIFALAANTFASYVVTSVLRAREFAALSRLARTIPIRYLQRPDDLDRLPELCRLVLEDLEYLEARIA